MAIDRCEQPPQRHRYLVASNCLDLPWLSSMHHLSHQLNIAFHPHNISDTSSSSMITDIPPLVLSPGTHANEDLTPPLPATPIEMTPEPLQQLPQRSPSQEPHTPDRDLAIQPRDDLDPQSPSTTVEYPPGPFPTPIYGVQSSYSIPPSPTPTPELRTSRSSSKTQRSKERMNRVFKTRANIARRRHAKRLQSALKKHIHKK